VNRPPPGHAESSALSNTHFYALTGMLTRLFRLGRTVLCQIHRPVATESGPFGSRCHQLGLKGTMAVTHGCLTSMKGHAMTFRSGHGRAGQMSKETTHPRSRPRLRGLPSHDHSPLNPARAGQRPRARPTYRARDTHSPRFVAQRCRRPQGRSQNAETAQVARSVRGVVRDARINRICAWRTNRGWQSPSVSCYRGWSPQDSSCRGVTAPAHDPCSAGSRGPLHAA
jgi:hypothetical protein